MARSRSLAALFAVASLSACGNPSGGAPGAVSEGEAQALEEAAQMLDEKRLPEGALPEESSPEPVAPAAEPSQEDQE